MDGVLKEIADEALVAERRYGQPMSTHESYGVLAEEMAELLDAIRANALESVRNEAIQIAAVAARLALACRGRIDFARRSGATEG